MRPASPDATWTAVHECAIQRILVDGWSLRAAAAAPEVGVNKNTLLGWTKTQAWKQREAQIRAEVHQQVAEIGIAQKAERLRRRDRDWRGIQEVIGERAAHYRTLRAKHERLADQGTDFETTADLPSIPPGAETGLIVEVPTRDGPRYQLDKAALDALEAMEASTARDLGEVPSAAGAGKASSTGLAIYLEDNRLLPGYALASAVDAFEAAFALMAQGCLPESTEADYQAAYRLARLCCGFGDDEPWDWDPEILKAVTEASWALPLTPPGDTK